MRAMNSDILYDYDHDIELGETDENGVQMRPDVVWFGEEVSNINKSAEIINDADILIIIGTSMLVYPAASLCEYRTSNCDLYIINPDMDGVIDKFPMATLIQKKATEGVNDLLNKI